MFKRSIFNFEFKVIALMLFIFVIVVVTGAVAYSKFSNLLENISKSVRTDNRLVLSHTLKNDLTELANIAKTHSLTEDNSYLEKYTTIRGNVLNKLKELKGLNESKSEEINIGFLDTLINDKLIVLDGIMYSEDPFRVQTALGKVVVNLDVSNFTDSKGEYGSRSGQMMERSSSSSQLIRDEVELELLRNSKEQLESLEKEEEKLLKKLKRAEKRKNSNRMSEVDSLLNLRKEEAKKIHRKLVKAEEHEQDKALTINQIYRGIEVVSTEELLIEKEIKMAQLELISMDNILSLQIAKLFDDFELRENATIAEATRYAEQENKKTTIQVAIFCVFVAVLLIVMAYIIIQYVKKNNLYKTALKRSNNEAEKLSKTRERLMATISHEIRTPMHAISGFSEQLSKEKLSEKQQEYLVMIQKSAKHLTYLVNDVLDFSKLQNGKLKLDKSPANIRELINDTVMFSKQLVQDNRLNIKLRMDSSIADFYKVDAHRLRQILLNIMSNAVKFTDEGTVTLEVDLQERKGKEDTIRITVKDTGIGMDQEELEKVFTEFEQAGKGARNKISGTGLGLPITKKLIELHKGQIQLSSDKGQGTKVEMILGLEQVERLEQVKQEEKTTQLPCSNILIVDDEVYNRKLLRAMLGNYNTELIEAENGEDAIKSLRKKPVDLILLDSRMPVMDGKDTIDAIKKLDDKSKRNVKIIMLTAAGNEINELIERVDGYVSKPFTEQALINEIERVFGNNVQEIDGAEEINENSDDKSVDFTNLRSISGSDRNFYADMLQTFITTTSESHKNIKAAFSNKDWELVANEAHKMASPCKHIGANGLHSLLKEIEKATRTEQPGKQSKGLIKELDDEIETVLMAVNQELTTIN